MQPLRCSILSRFVAGSLNAGAGSLWQNTLRVCLLAACSSGMLPWQDTAVQAQTASLPPVTQAEIFHVISRRNELSLTERFSRVLELEHRITRVDGFDPAVLTVSALTPHRIRVQAVSAGVTTIVLVDEFDKTYTIEVFVEGDVRHLQAYIERFFPDSSVKAVKVRDSVVLRGVVADPTHISQITEVAEQFFPKVINQMQFGAANQVRLQVQIMEAQRSRIRELGFNWSLLTSNAAISSTPGNLDLGRPSIEFGILSGSTSFIGFLEALKRERLLKVLVETTVVADSGRPASLLSGGEFPFPVPQSLGTNTIEWKEYGVKLEAVPIVLGQGQVILEIAPEFSERDYANAITLNGETLAGLMTRKANTQVRMKFGQTLMIGGLITTRYTAETHKIPFLGELPGIGMAFRHVKYDENETELIILVTPEYVAPLSPHQVPEGGPGQFTDIVTDRELYWGGLLEVPNYGGPTPPMPGHAQEVFMDQPHQMAYPPVQQAPATPHMTLPPQPLEDDFESGPPPFEMKQTPFEMKPEPGGMSLTPPPVAPQPAQITPVKPTPVDPAVPPMPPASPVSPPLSIPNNTSSTPLLPVLPPPSSKVSAQPITHVQEAGHWQRRTERPEVQMLAAEHQGQNQTRLTVATQVHNRPQTNSAQEQNGAPSLIQPSARSK